MAMWLTVLKIIKTMILNNILIFPLSLEVHKITSWFLVVSSSFSWKHTCSPYSELPHLENFKVYVLFKLTGASENRYLQWVCTESLPASLFLQMREWGNSSLPFIWTMKRSPLEQNHSSWQWHDSGHDMWHVSGHLTVGYGRRSA